MDRKSRIMHSAGNSFAAIEMRKYFGFDQWGNDPEMRKDDIDFELDSSKINLFKGSIPNVQKYSYKLDLCGEWKLSSPASDDFEAVDISAQVPGSIHTACMAAGVLNDPYVGKNDAIANAFSGREWTYERTFVYEGKGQDVRLSFDGVCDRCEVFLNDTLLGTHQGMFGGPFFDITSIVVNGENTIKVKLLPAIHFTQTVVFNCSDGWHYARIWPLGIWNKVYIEDVPVAYSGSPFISTYDSVQGTLDLSMPITVKEGNLKDYFVRVFITPKNFDGKTYTFDCEAKDRLYIRFDMPEFKLWWPNGRGEQNLYLLYVQIICSKTDTIISERKSSFGIRQLEMAAYPSGEKQSQYNRTVVINGEGIFMKGAGWCTIDALMRYKREDYDRILSRAKQQGLNFFRAWGGGLAETDDFYDLCDEYGICVYQEWPCCWDSQAVQPKEPLYECVRLNTIRMRNHPSLTIYGGGNEGCGVIEDEALNMIGRLTYEYDGTRTYFRQDGGVGGAGMTHDHIHWGGEKPEHYISRYAHSYECNMHEYGLDAFMNIGSIKKYATLQEMLEWPIKKFGTVAHHTATFNGEYGWSPTPYGHDIVTFEHYASMFTPVDNIARLCIGSQLAQTMAKVPCIVNSRIKWPNTTANIYYKMNDIYPGAAWSVVDWYGAPKLAHYICQDAHAPLMAGGFMDRYNTFDKEDSKSLDVPVYILDDNLLLEGNKWRVSVMLFDADLKIVNKKDFEGSGLIGKSGMIGSFHADETQLLNAPQFIVFDLYVNDKFVSRYYMPMNFDNNPGCLFKLPHATLCVQKVNKNSIEDAARIKAIEANNYDLPNECKFGMHGIENSDKAYIITNTSDVPATYVHFICSEREDSFICSDNYFWLMPGESKVVYVDSYEGITDVGCFNYDNIDNELSLVKRTKNKHIALSLSGISETSDSVKLKWSKLSSAPDNIIGYNVYSGDNLVAGIATASNQKDFECVIDGLNESEVYTFSIAAVDDEMNEYIVPESIDINVLPDMESPRVLNVFMRKEDTVEVVFSKNVNIVDAENVNNYQTENGTVISGEMKSGYDDRVMLKISGVEGKILHGMKMHVSGITDTTKNHNMLQDTSCIIFGQVTETDFSDDNGIKGVMTGFSIGNCARICFKVKTDLNSKNTFRVLLAKGAKGDKMHFEFYINNIGELRMFSNKGDHYLGVNVDAIDDFFDIEIKCSNNNTAVYCNGEFVKSMSDALMRTEAYGLLTLGSLNDGSLRFTGELKDVAMYSWFVD